MSKPDAVITENKNKLYKKLNDEEQKELLSWWEELQENKGVCAGLRRCSTPGEAALFMETFRLRFVLKRFGLSPGVVAAVAGTLAHIKKGEGKAAGDHFATALGRPNEAGRAVFSESRFRRLVNSRSLEELFTSLRRAVKMMKDKANPLSVADGIILWSDGQRFHSGSFSRFQYDWSLNYYEQFLRNENQK